MVTGIGGGATVPGGDKVDISLKTIQFVASVDGGTNWLDAGSAVVLFIFTAGTPNPPGGALREDALKEGAAAAALANTAPQGLRGLIAKKLIYTMATTPSSFAEDDTVMQLFQTLKAECDAHAYLMRYLALTLGLSADVRYLWMGRKNELWLYPVPKLIEYYVPFQGCSWPSFQCDRPKEDDMPANPEFLFHAVTDVGGGELHDPSYDLLGLPAF